MYPQRQISNEYGLIDLSKMGCASERFLATTLEIRDARDGGMRRAWLSDSPTINKESAAAQGVLAFLAVNLLGFAFLGLRGVFRWIADGFKSSGTT